MAGFWAGRRRGARELEARDAAEAKRVGSALFAADERIRLAAEELGFAEAVLGTDIATARTAALLVVARDRLGEAFRLDRLNRDAIPGTAEDVRARTIRILELCEWIERVLLEQTSALADRMARARRAPEAIVGLRVDVERLRARIPQARATLARLEARYARRALVDVASGPAEAARQLGFAEHSLAVAVRRLEADERDAMLVALEASARSVRRAESLLDAVEGFEIDALRAEAELGELVVEARRTLAVAAASPHSRGPTAVGSRARERAAPAPAPDAPAPAAAPAPAPAPAPEAMASRSRAAVMADRSDRAASAGTATRSRAVADAIVVLESVLADLPVAGVDTDPIGHLERLREAHAVLTAALAADGERGARRVLPASHVHDAVANADRQLDLARDAVVGHPGRVGAAAFARLAESEHLRIDLGHYLGSSAAEVAVVDLDHRDRVIGMARRAAELAAEAVRLARRDLEAARAFARTAS
ncbi:hypothetical protein [Agromyces sp. GXS1127]|uniref:hypothetical protein n=1 Tax=Agromyces sp. GXS1127 TaxID=3424181 RepID=UPI003D316F1F